MTSAHFGQCGCLCTTAASNSLNRRWRVCLPVCLSVCAAGNGIAIAIDSFKYSGDIVIDNVTSHGNRALTGEGSHVLLVGVELLCSCDAGLGLQHCAGVVAPAAGAGLAVQYRAGVVEHAKLTVLNSSFISNVAGATWTGACRAQRLSFRSCSLRFPTVSRLHHCAAISSSSADILPEAAAMNVTTSDTAASKQPSATFSGSPRIRNVNCTPPLKLECGVVRRRRWNRHHHSIKHV